MWMLIFRRIFVVSFFFVHRCRRRCLHHFYFRFSLLLSLSQFELERSLDLWLRVCNIRHASNAPNWIQNNQIYYNVVRARFQNNNALSIGAEPSDDSKYAVWIFVFSFVESNKTRRRERKISKNNIETNNSSTCISMEKRLSPFCLGFKSKRSDNEDLMLLNRCILVAAVVVAFSSSPFLIHPFMLIWVFNLVLPCERLLCLQGFNFRKLICLPLSDFKMNRLNA